ncbi:hypothetical protein MCHIJ_30390 [Mycolicibacterium chitae]|uniref:Phage protein n=1 Tax=Mycolicibacterium chitae TaxID=1792 RepID=A0A3S4RCP1_MYCCI|nr:hypothetical protein [Mycolicibacterium chitae]MCV7108915.1 hypothetical protein [Mycolicibacterium chitae]BBZ03602.1 hypothetical protein MCHIJ_30390 [Mycolicibacterium chitae]VEG47257.1 Uncharacterised protein [Mycolicibacterium chitae]
MSTDDNIIEFKIRQATEKLIGQIEPRFKVYDDPRTYATAELDRVVCDVFGWLEPFEPAADTWRSMPLRLVHHAGAGWHLECGPVNLDAADIALLRQAIEAYDAAVGR